MTVAPWAAVGWNTATDSSDLTLLQNHEIFEGEANNILTFPSTSVQRVFRK